MLGPIKLSRPSVWADALKVRRNTGQQLIVRSVLGARARQGWESTDLIDKRSNGGETELRV